MVLARTGEAVEHSLAAVYFFSGWWAGRSDLSNIDA